LNAFCVQKIVGKFLQTRLIHTFIIKYIYMFSKIMFFKDKRRGRQERTKKELSSYRFVFV